MLTNPTFSITKHEEQDCFLDIAICSSRAGEFQLTKVNFVCCPTNAPVANLSVRLNRIVNHTFRTFQNIFIEFIASCFTIQWPFQNSLHGFDGIVCSPTECGIRIWKKLAQDIMSINISTRCKFLIRVTTTQYSSSLGASPCELYAYFLSQYLLWCIIGTRNHIH